MKQFFKIYPALFTITQRKENKFFGFDHIRMNNEQKMYGATDSGYDLSQPQLHYGNCIVNAAHTLVTLNLRNMIGADSEFELPDSLLGRLKSETYQGKYFIISYVPVLN